MNEQLNKSLAEMLEIALQPKDHNIQLVRGLMEKLDYKGIFKISLIKYIETAGIDYLKAVENLRRKLNEKAASYGRKENILSNFTDSAEFFDAPPDTLIWLRMYDKTSRLENGSDPIDPWFDIAGYCVLLDVLSNAHGQH